MAKKTVPETKDSTKSNQNDSVDQPVTGSEPPTLEIPAAITVAGLATMMQALIIMMVAVNILQEMNVIVMVTVHVLAMNLHVVMDLVSMAHGNVTARVTVPMALMKPTVHLVDVPMVM